MLDQSKLAKLEIQGVTAGNTLEELLALSSAIEGAIRILDARSKELQKQLDEYLRSQTKPKRIEFADEPEEDDADILINQNGGGGTEDTYTVITSLNDETPDVLSNKIVIDDTVKYLLTLNNVNVADALFPTNHKLTLGLTQDESIGIPRTELIEEQDEDGSTKQTKRIVIDNIDGLTGPVMWTDNTITVATDISEYVSLNALFNNCEKGAVVLDDGITTTNNIEDYMDSDLLLALQELSNILNSGHDGFLKVNGSSLDVVQYATCDEDTTV